MKYFLHTAWFGLCLLSALALDAQVSSAYSTSCGLQVNATLAHPTCPGGDDGWIEVDFANDTGVESFSWYTMGPLPIDSNGPVFLTAGLYRVEVNDGMGCLDTLVFELSDPPLLVEVTLFREDVRCFGEQNGRINLMPDHPEKVEQYFINGEPQMNTNTAADEFVITDLPPGQYSIVIQDISGCLQEDFAVIEEPERLELRVDTGEASCEEASDGYFVLSAEGGVGNYRYSLDGQLFSDVLAYEEVEVGEYTVYARDGNDCVRTRTFSITPEPEPQIRFQKQDVTCPGGGDAEFIVIIETVGLTQGDDYQFALAGLPFQEDSTFTDLPAGDYEVNIRNVQNSCISTASITIEEPDAPQIDFQKEDVTCPGGADARFIVIIETVGLLLDEDYDFSLDGTNYQADSLFENLSVGIYTLYVRNSQSCVQTQSVVIEEPTAPNVLFDQDDVTCPGGTDGRFIVIIETVGLSLGEDYEFSLDGVIYQADSLFENLSAGGYQVFVRSAANCLQTALVVIEEPGQPDMDLQIQGVTCPGAADGEVRIQVSPVGSYQFSLDGQSFQSQAYFDQLAGGFYELRLRDSNACMAMTGFFVEEASWPDYEVEGLAVSCHGQANGQIHIEVESGAMPFRYSLDDVHYQYGSSFAHLSAGSYMVYLRDDSDCVYTEAVVIEQPTALANEMISGAATCGYANGWMAAELSGGTPGYTYTWSNGATTGVIAELPSAWYGLTVQDEQGCTLVDSLYIENVAGPQLSAQSRSATCHDHTDGAIDLDILSSAPIRRVMWSNGARTEDIDALAAGTYAVTVVDRNECPTSETFEVAAPKPLQLTSQMDQMGNTAMIQVQPSGGTGNYTYQWSNGAEGAVLMGLSPGDYMLSLSDEQQCSHIATFTVLPVDLPLEDNILVYPVPTFDEVTVQLDLPERQAIELSLWDELGRMLMKSVEGELINESITLDLSSLPAAVYYLRVKVAADHFVYRLVKQQD